MNDDAATVSRRKEAADADARARLRDEFAMAALTGLLATWHLRNEFGEYRDCDPREDDDDSLMGNATSLGMSAQCLKTHDGGGSDAPKFSVAGYLVSEAYDLADAALAEREKRP